MSINSTDPGTLFGGAWERIEDTFLLCAGSSYTAGTTGGSATMAHTHSQVAFTSGGPSNNTSGSTAISIAQMPSHNHGGAGNHNHLYPDEATGDSSAPYWSVITNTSHNTSGGRAWYSYTNYAGEHTHTSQGSGQGHTHTLSSHTHSIGATTTGGASNTNNMPPYLAVYVWQRVS